MKNLIKNKFRLIFNGDEELENLELDILEVSLPDVSIGVNQTRYRSGTTIKIAGDTIDFGTLSVTFRVDNELRNYETILDWIFQLRDPSTGLKEERYVPATLQLYLPNGKMMREILFYNVFPSSLTKLDFKTNTTDTEYIESTVVFEFDYYEITKLDIKR